jgi:hypothetical protein
MDTSIVGVALSWFSARVLIWISNQLSAEDILISVIAFSDVVAHRT